MDKKTKIIIGVGAGLGITLLATQAFAYSKTAANLRTFFTEINKPSLKSLTLKFPLKVQFDNNSNNKLTIKRVIVTLYVFDGESYTAIGSTPPSSIPLIIKENASTRQSFTIAVPLLNLGFNALSIIDTMQFKLGVTASVAGLQYSYEYPFSGKDFGIGEKDKQAITRQAALLQNINTLRPAQPIKGVLVRDKKLAQSLAY